MNIGCLGEGMIEIGGAPLRRAWGGDTLNTAVYLARLAGAVHRVHYLSALGGDSLSDALLADWADEGIDTTRVARLAGRMPGLYLVETDAHGERRFHYWRSDSAARHHFAGGLDFAATFAGLDAIYLSGITLALFPPAERDRLLDALRQARAQGTRVWFDNNFRPALWSAAEAADAYRALLPHTDIALLTEDDEHAVFGDATPERIVARTLAAGCGEVVLKRGAQPALAATAAETAEVAPAPVRPVVDTCAAGDSFGAAYLMARLAGHGLAAALAAGHALAGTVIGYPGAIIPRSAMLGAA
ncbi:sugar kinase [Chitiniphilus shinanonensis]|uniref:sugar kinase n=1 Tax=Chitiniphilus shinanonensis TaxID=553088 RepID=UPI000361A357|nr:sugar kinase [Chitiniphilus shinanonensis]